MISFRRISSGDRALLSGFAAADREESCERCWGNLRIYQDSYDWHYAVCGNYMLLASQKARLLQFPTGPEPMPELLAELIRQTTAAGFCQAACYDAPAAYSENHPELEKFFEVDDDPGEADYVYDLKHLETLTGEHLRKKHNQIRQFEREFENRYQVRALDSRNLPELLSLAFQLNAPFPDTGSRAQENLALKRLPEIFENEADTALDGILLYVDDRLAGFSVFSPLSPDMVDIHFEKASRDFRNAATMVTWELIRYLRNKGYRWMNREQDLNLPGLRQAKESWEPDHLYRRLALTLREP